MLSRSVNCDDNQNEIEIQPIIESETNQIEFKIVGKDVNNNKNGDKTENSSVEFVSNNFELFWKNVSFEVKQNVFKKFNGIPYKVVKKDKQIIRNLSGRISSGRLTAILGPNGAGKTTLLECLCGRRRAGLTGDIYVIDKCSKREITFAYYSQKDTLLDTLTVEETLLFASQIKYNEKNKRIEHFFNSDIKNDFVSVPNKLHSNKNFHRFKVQNLIQDLNLEKCSKTEVKHCSGGQRRRLSIALELIFSPSILLLDEPTSGLDSLSTNQCIKLLKQLSQRSDNQMIIGVIIHQPTAKLLSYFDDLYVLSCTGQCIYEGPTTQILDKLSEYGLICPPFHNPSDFIVEIGSGDHGFDTIRNLVKLHENLYKNSTVDKNFIELSKIVEQTQKHTLKDQLLSVWPLIKRALKISLKDRKQYTLQLTSVVIMLICVFVLHLDNKIGLNDACIEKPSIEYFSRLHVFDILNPIYSPYPNWAFIFYSMLFVVFVAMLPTLLSLPLELSIFTKEHSNGWYSLGSYFLAKNLADILPNLIFPVLYGVCSYIMTAQIMEFWRFFGFISILTLLAILTQGFGFLISAIFVDSVTASTVIGAIINIPLLLFCGLLIKIRLIPEIFQPFTYLSYFKLAFESLIILIFGYDRCQPFEKVSVKTLKNEFGDQFVPIFKCIYDYDSDILDNVSDIMDYFNNITQNGFSFSINAFEYNENHLLFNVILLIILTILFRVLAYFMLVWRTRVK